MNIENSNFTTWARLKKHCWISNAFSPGQSMTLCQSSTHLHAKAKRNAYAQQVHPHKDSVNVAQIFSWVFSRYESNDLGQSYLMISMH
ncbi:MAG: hypothetical protein H6645_05795 [Caldilineaceae bacterium]|nr:hypothetical protein [Caldilineaceae bacterium]